MSVDLNEITARVLAGGSLTDAEAYALAAGAPLDDLLHAAGLVTSRFHTEYFDSCSIINARSGLCSEDCRWCAQAVRYSTGAEEYPMVPHATCMALGKYNQSKGIARFSLVTSGRSTAGRALRTFCSYYRDLREECPGMGLCASMGLLGPDELKALREAGVERYHCNMETAPSHFVTLCSTHTQADKLATIRAAREAGMEVCSGGIIGMGETMEQRVEFALFLRDEVAPVSIPVNILHPIPGTPLEGMEPLSDDDILRTVAIMRLVHPRAVIRFAGGRDRISPDTQRRAMLCAVNGAIMGDLLTTVGASIDQDRRMAVDCGYSLEPPEV